jgi:hypothetical protein
MPADQDELARIFRVVTDVIGNLQEIVVRVLRVDLDAKNLGERSDRFHGPVTILALLGCEEKVRRAERIWDVHRQGGSTLKAPRREVAPVVRTVRRGISGFFPMADD